MKRLAILGSTGSVGVQTLQLVTQYPDQFSVEVLSAHSNFDLLALQARLFRPKVVVLSNSAKLSEIKRLIPEIKEIYSGSEGLALAVQRPEVDLVVNAIHGYAGLFPSLKALEAGKNIALANKETLVIAGQLVRKLAQEHHAFIFPIDSEHSALSQCLAGESPASVEKIYLTASGGPFFGKSLNELMSVSLEDALQHPVWKMGKKITIDSASMMNKGFEMIEARWLFELKPDQIEILIHPASIVHSLVQFIDGSIQAQLSIPDMQIPILYALTHPTRIKTTAKRLTISDLNRLNFYPPDPANFPNLRLATEALHRGGNLPCLLNAANEMVVDAFLQGKIRFHQMPEFNETIIRKCRFIEHPDYGQLVESDTEGRKFANQLF
jgi:1-deoxy-D-xylulose-5-phosphate reductoisomerase